jgi:hypothetical protein
MNGGTLLSRRCIYASSARGRNKGPHRSSSFGNHSLPVRLSHGATILAHAHPTPKLLALTHRIRFSGLIFPFVRIIYLIAIVFS